LVQYNKWTYKKKLKVISVENLSTKANSSKKVQLSDSIVLEKFAYLGSIYDIANKYFTSKFLFNKKN